MKRTAFERLGLVRAAIDERLGLTEAEFRVEGDLVAIGPIYDADAFAVFVQELEQLGLTYYDDFFELTGSWPEWLAVFAASPGPGRSKPSHPQQ